MGVLFFVSLLAVLSQPTDQVLGARILQLLHTVLSTDDPKQEEAAEAEAKQIFLTRGLPTPMAVGDEASYEFVVLTCSPGPPAFQAQVLAQTKHAAARHELPPDAALYCEARVRQDRVKARAKTHPPTNPALRDEIERLFTTDQAARQQKDFDAAKMMAADREHAAALRTIFEKYSVPTYAMVGPEAASHFTVMVQHQSAAFREQVLPKLKANVDAGQADPGSYAMVYDRAARDAGRNQRYGENLECSTENPTLHEAPIADVAHVNLRRAQLGLFRIELYARMVVENSPAVCPALPAAK